MKRRTLQIAVLVLTQLFSTIATAQLKPITQTISRLNIAKEMQMSVDKELLNKWYPLSTDSIDGGFLSTFTFDFKPVGTQDKFIVTQARHIWSTAKAAIAYPEKKYYLAAAKIGFLFLKNKMWDSIYGGFYNLVDRKGKDKSNLLAPKEAYGNAFAIYALSEYYQASGDLAALKLATQTFMWLEKHSHDTIFKGYYQHLKRNGTPVLRDTAIASTAEIGYKDQNSSIHLLEAFTALYKVWPNQLVKMRLQEMLYLVRDKLTSKKGSLSLFFTANWTPVSFKDSTEAVILKHKNLDHVSFGHDVETAYLMEEAAVALGKKNDLKTFRIGKKMVDHALKNGWDNSIGGFYDEGYYFKGSDTISIILDSKNWWAQAEGLNTLLIMADRYPTDTMHYYRKFTLLWNYVKSFLIDHENGDWYEEGIDKEPQRKTALKGHIWKGTYHTYRALANCIERLKHSR